MPKNIKNETPEQRFLRVASKRTNAVLEKLRLLGNCSNRRLYRYTEKEIDKIFTAIIKETREIRLKFNAKKKEKFKF